MRRHKITHVAAGSIAESLAIASGDFLLAINDVEIKDVFDYRMAVADEELLVLIEKPDGEQWELDIEKDADDDLGLEFETALMDDIRTCRNRCMFCFVDQQPPGLRDSLYVKDDDIRLSFLHGNYVTLTNVDDAEAQRIARLHLSPLRISVHTVDATLRQRLTGNKHAGRLAAQLKRFNEAGIEMHFQAVICKGINDGAKLDETIETLLGVQPGGQSLAIVPAGVTKHRKGLTALAAFTPEDAAAVISQVAAWQAKARAKLGRAFVFAADEWYGLAGQDAPTAAACEDFPQLENGVGLCGLFAREFLTAMENSLPTYSPVRIGVATGEAAFLFMSNLMRQFAAKHPDVQIQTFAVRNDFFGETVTVSGLLTGGDIVAQLRARCAELDVLFLPANAFRAGTEDMLDGMTRAEVEAAMGVPVCNGSADGGMFYEQLKLTLNEKNSR